MILIITLNPLLEFRYTLHSFAKGTNNRDAQCSNLVGGKGINVSRQLKSLGVDSFNFLFAGPVYGKKIKELLDQESLKCTTVKTREDSRTAAVIIEEDQKIVSTVFGINQHVSAAEAADFTGKLEKMIQNCEILICSGSSPCQECDSIFPEALRLAEKFDKISILDTYGIHFEACLAAKPTIVHNTLSEVLSLPVSENPDESAIRGALQKIHNCGVKQVYLTNGSEPFYASTFGFSYKVTPPKVDEFDATGSGDAFTAGIAFAHYTDLTFDQGIRFATALGAANAMQETVCCVSAELAEELVKKVTVEPVGPKMKVIDVTPTI
jgi:1-phosphofructokinase family hexose kinase